MSLRAITAVDAAWLAQIHAAAFTEPWDEAAMTGLINNGGFGVVAPEGFILLQGAADEAEILTLAVHPAARRQGLARRLAAEGEKLAALRGAQGLFLEVAEDNVPALALYRQAGFHKTGVRKGYYLRQDGKAIDAIVMCKTLNRTNL